MGKLKDFGFDEYLRYVFSGGITLFAWIVLYPDKVSSPLIKAMLSSGVVPLGLSLIIGALIYGIHRAIIYPWLLQPLMFRIVDREFYCKFTLLELNILSWKRLKDEKNLLHHIRNWASQFHFLWCTSWGVVGTLLIGIWLPHSQKRFWFFCILACVTLLSAFVDTARAMEHEKTILLKSVRKIEDKEPEVDRQ